jgi:fructokinase
MPYAVVMGEALVDLLQSTVDGERVYREAVGGAPLNVAVGVARLGGSVEFVGSLGTDLLAGRIRAFLDAAGVSTRGCVATAAPTTLALTTFDGAEPDFHFYGEPPSYGRLRPADVDADMVARAAVLYCGSIALLCPDALAAARTAWAAAADAGPLRAFDPNVRARLMTDAAGYRAVVEEFAAGADLVKLSAADAAVLYGDPGAEAGAGVEAGAAMAGARLLDAGAGAVVVTLGARGALVLCGSEAVRVAAPAVRAVDATGAGDAAMAALVYALLVRAAAPTDAAGWVELAGFATSVAALVCEAPGGATAMPTLAAVRDRFPGTPLPASPG